MSKPTIKSLTEQLEIGEKQYQELRKEKNVLHQVLQSTNAKVAELLKEVETLKEEKQKLENKGIADYESLFDSYEKLKSDYALLEEKYYTQSDNYTEVNKEYKALLDKFTEVSAEKHALKQENERTNRHINLAENVIHEAKEQQPLVVNHYHNCVINK